MPCWQASALLCVRVISFYNHTQVSLYFIGANILIMNNDIVSTTRRGTPYRKPEVQAEEMGGQAEEEEAVISDLEFEKREAAERELLEQQAAKESRELALAEARGQRLADEEEDRQRQVRETEERLELMRQEIAWLEEQTKMAGRAREAPVARRAVVTAEERRRSPELDAEAFYTPRGVEESPEGLVGRMWSVGRGVSAKPMPRPPNPRVLREEMMMRGPADARRFEGRDQEPMLRVPAAARGFEAPDPHEPEVIVVERRPPLAKAPLDFNVASPGAASLYGSRAKLARVDFPSFEGSPQEDPARFLMEFELAAIAAQLEEGAMVSTMGAQSLKGGAKSWFLSVAAPSVRQFCEQCPFRDFLTMFSDEFQVAAPSDVARQKRAELIQDGSVEAFVVEWRKLDAQLGSSSTDADRKFMFLSKLKADVRGFVSASNPRNLSMAIAAAMRYATENEATAGKRATSKTVHLNTLRVQGEDWESQLEAAVEAKMRELNALQRTFTRKRGSLFSPEKKELYDRGLCFKCKKPGHQAKDCSKRAQSETSSAVGKSGGGGGTKA
jgi:hypothetical protein